MLSATFIRCSSMEDKTPNQENISSGLLGYIQGADMLQLLPAYLKHLEFLNEDKARNSESTSPCCKKFPNKRSS
ncbi:hypothetical protein Y1Q_0016090 [Alligator mississippiensis]|uniref:Uncharacterized protein n=1 Tax=Alligator mississippiensis TaxID=8496 RepID=A0A151P184_ALLMI|nr:hypothetical protein Y1Q_0016090 [Alligator mississippiensis]